MEFVACSQLRTPQNFGFGASTKRLFWKGGILQRINVCKLLRKTWQGLEELHDADIWKPQRA